MTPIKADVRKVRTLIEKDGWQLIKFNTVFLPSVPGTMNFIAHTRASLRRGKGELVLESDDDAFFKFCNAHQRSLDNDGAPALRGIADTDRYHQELERLTADADRKRREAAERYVDGKIALRFDPVSLVTKFLKSRDWSNSEYLPLKDQYFETFAAALVAGQQLTITLHGFLSRFPAAKPYSERIELLLKQAFTTDKEPVRSLLRFADVAEINIDQHVAKFLQEAKQTSDLFEMLIARGSTPGDRGFPYLIDIYRRYAEWARPILIVLSEAVSILEGRPLPNPKMGMTKRVDLIRSSKFADIVDCFDPRIRHAASHNAITYDEARKMVQFQDLDSDGNNVGQFELEYTDLSNKIRNFTEGLVPGMLAAFGLRRQALLLLTLLSGDYVRLLLLIDNEAK